MNWTRASDLRAQLERLWERGDLLRATLDASAWFPLRFKLKSPSASQLSSEFAAVRNWIAELQALPELRIDWRETKHRVLGTQRLPQALWLDTPEQALNWLAKSSQAQRFRQLNEQTRQSQPELLSWLAKRPLQALALHAEWPHLLALVAWLAQHPHPAIYLRQVDLAGIHSKFIEAQRSVLTELLDLVLPAQAIASEHTGVHQFAARYGFLDKPLRVRFRLLDQSLPLLSGAACPDITLDATSFAALQAPWRHVFITENEINFLAFPALANAIVIFGAGYGWDALARADWLARCQLHYWGDIDTHGFAILDQLRGYFAHVQSLLMDRQTLLQHQALWGLERQQVQHDLARLSAPEKALYDELRDNRIRPGLRLEQEFIGFAHVTAALQMALREVHDQPRARVKPGTPDDALPSGAKSPHES